MKLDTVEVEKEVNKQYILGMNMFLGKLDLSSIAPKILSTEFKKEKAGILRL